MLVYRQTHHQVDRVYIVIVSDIRRLGEDLARVLSQLPDVETIHACESAADASVDKLVDALRRGRVEMTDQP